MSSNNSFGVTSSFADGLATSLRSNASTTFEEVNMGNVDNDDSSTATESTNASDVIEVQKEGQQQQTKQLHVRWARLQKEVEIKTDDKTLPSSSGTDGSNGKIQKKVILNEISGEARPGEILAIMGPSGGGKTSLMNVLSGRAAYQEGAISVNGSVLDAKMMKRFKASVAYVKQQDLFFESLTVRDQLTYTARLRFPDQNIDKKLRDENIRNEVNRIIKLLRLTKVADSQIFMCSGGEKKRVNIGTELITNPSVILLDEPTSGLDSASAVSLLNVLKDLAKQGKTIITSIHQPNSESFLSFDKLMMLSDGKVVFFGPPKDSLDYLRTQGYANPDGYNLADHWMNLLVTDSSVEEERKEAAAAANKKSGRSGSIKHAQSPRFALQNAWDNEAVANKIETANEIISGSDVGDTTGNSFEVNKSESKYATTWWTQFKTLTDRALKKSKTTVLSPVNIVKTIAIGIVVGLVFLQQSYTENDAFNIYSYFFFTMVYWVMQGLFEALFSFPQERVIVLKERATASYGLSAYFASVTVADLPVFLFMPCIYMVISYWMIVPTLGFAKFLAILCISFLSIMTGQALGGLVGAAFDDIKIAQAIATVVILFLMLLGGFFARNIPAWLSWVQYLSPFMYASNAALLVIFQDPVPCDGSGQFCDSDDVFTMIPADDVLDSFGVYGTVGFNVGLLVFLCIIPRFFTYAILRRKKGGERE